MPTRAVLPRRTRTLIRVAAVAVLLGGVLVPTAGAGAASSTCDPIRALLGLCPAISTGGGSGPAPTCGGEAPLKPNGTRWRCSFDEEFTGASLDRSKWIVQTTAQYGFHAGAECMVDSPQNLSVDKGHLNLTVRDVGAPFTCKTPRRTYTTRYTGASVYTKWFGQQYGRIEIRAKFPQSYGISGIQSSLWMFPRQFAVTGVVSGATEIDVAEAYSRHPNIVVPTVHGLTVSSLMLNSYCTVPDWGAAFHTYGAVWNRSTVTFSYDGKACLKVPTPPSLPSTVSNGNPFLVALTQGMGVGVNKNTTAPPLPGTEKIDWVRVWK